MRKILLSVSFVLVLAVQSFAGLSNMGGARGVSKIKNGTGITVSPAGGVGEVTVDVKSSSTFIGVFQSSSGGLISNKETFYNLPALSSGSRCGSATPILVTTKTLVEVGVTSTTNQITQDSDARTAIVIVTFTRVGGRVEDGLGTGGSTTYIRGTIVIKGTDCLGNFVTEVIDISTYNYLNCGSTVGVGSVAFVHIASYTIFCSSISGREPQKTTEFVSIYLGRGNAIGLVTKLEKETDVYNVSEAGVNSKTYSLNVLKNTITFANAPNGTNTYNINTKKQSLP